MSGDGTDMIDTYDWYWGPGGVADAFNDPDRMAIVDGAFFYLADGEGFGDIPGFGGRRFEFEFSDGRHVVSHDVWSPGRIPGAWRFRFPDNARIIRPEDNA